MSIPSEGKNGRASDNEVEIPLLKSEFLPVLRMAFRLSTCSTTVLFGLL